MTRPSIAVWLTAVAVLLGGSARPAQGQEPLPDLSLEELMHVDAGRVFGASARSQSVIEAPASVSFITADEIARYGYRTLADILRGVRGMYVTDDRNFSYLGTRGFGNPGDYNSRILLLVNGHRVNDNVYGQAEIGAEFGIDPAMFERVEIIRGPASSLYGDSAFFAVVNVITRSGASLGGASVTVEAGTLGTVLTRISDGRKLGSGADLAVSATYERSAGNPTLFFPAFDTPATNNGIAQGLDGERVADFYAQLRFKSLIFTGAYGTRERDVPTASFGTIFDDQQSKEESTDRHTLAVLEYNRSLGGTAVMLRGSFDRFTYDGNYPLVADVGAVALIGHNSVVGTRWSAEARATRTVPGRQVLTLGTEFIDNLHQDQELQYVGQPTPVFDAVASSVQGAVYGQDEIRLTGWLTVNGGLRYDRYQTFQKATPRAAVIVMPSSNQSFKYLYGRAFRAPNEYERSTFYFGDATANLRPESIDTHEVVWERYTHDWLRTSVSSYWYKADNLITPAPDPSAFVGTTYVNAGRVRAVGLELEAQMRLAHHVEGVASYALQRVKDVDTGESLVNSPEEMANFRISIPGPLDRSFVSAEVLSMSSRRTLANATLPPAATANLTVIAPVHNRFEIVASVKNLFNVQYADPASGQLAEDVIPQNGRTLRVGLTWKSAAK